MRRQFELGLSLILFIIRAYEDVQMFYFWRSKHLEEFPYVDRMFHIMEKPILV
jgi:hypothetical protein